MVAVVVVLAAVGTWGHRTSAAADSEKEVAISDTQGAIAAVRLHYDPKVDLELQSLYFDLFEKLPHDVRVTVLCPDRTSARRFQTMWGGYITSDGRDLTVVSIGGDLTLWARDRYLARQSRDLRDAGDGYAPSPDPSYGTPRLNEVIIQEDLSYFGVAPVVHDAPIHFEGGNVVSNRRHVFIGANLLPDNPSIPGAELLERITEIMGRPVVIVDDGEGGVPWCHVDMYLTPVDENTMLVADVKTGVDLAEALDDQVLLEEEADPAADEETSLDYIQRQLDGVARQMAQRGYSVQRIPATVDPLGDWMVTYNNVLMEEREGRRVAYVPRYRIPALDAEAVRIYRGLGFEVRSVDVSQVYRWGGALRCLVNVTERRRSSITSNGAVQPRHIRFVDLADPPSGQFPHDECKTRLR